MTPCISSCTENTEKQCNMVVPFLTRIMVRYIYFVFFYTRFYMNLVFFIRLNKQIRYICLHKDLYQI